MAKPYVLTGMLEDGKTVTLDQVLPLEPMRVRLVLEPFPLEPRKSYRDVVAGIRQRQQARGHQPRTRDEVDAGLNLERESWGE
jgi:hypothetical protein